METVPNGASTGNAAPADSWVSHTGAAKSHPKRAVTAAGGHLGATVPASSFHAQAIVTHNVQLLSDLCCPQKSPQTLAWFGAGVASTLFAKTPSGCADCYAGSTQASFSGG